MAEIGAAAKGQIAKKVAVIIGKVSNQFEQAELIKTASFWLKTEQTIFDQFFGR